MALTLKAMITKGPTSITLMWNSLINMNTKSNKNEYGINTYQEIILTFVYLVINCKMSFNRLSNIPQIISCSLTQMVTQSFSIGVVE